MKKYTWFIAKKQFFLPKFFAWLIDFHGHLLDTLLLSFFFPSLIFDDRVIFMKDHLKFSLSFSFECPDKRQTDLNPVGE